MVIFIFIFLLFCFIVTHGYAEYYAEFLIFAETGKDMATTRLYLDMRGKAKDGKGSVVITIYHNQTTSAISTGVRVTPSNWTGDSVVKVPGSDAINAYLQEKKAKLDKSIAILSLDDKYQYMTATQVKRAITEKREIRPSDHLVSSVFNEYISRGMSKSTEDIYRITMRKVLAFGGESMRIESIDLKWLLRFEAELAKSQGVNGRAIYLRSLRAVCNYARKMRLITDYPFNGFHIRQEPTEKRNIPVSNLRKIMSWPLDGDDARCRDYFMLMFYLIGINVTDLLHARKSDVVDGRLEYRRRKTGKPYSIKIEPEAWEIIRRYSGKDWLLDALDSVKLYKSFAKKINRTLQSIGDIRWEDSYDDDLFAEPRKTKVIEPIIPDLTTYYSRHSWATIAKGIGIPLDIISQALGHSFGNKTTLIYVEYDQKLVDEANRKVIDYLLCLDKTAL